MKTAIFCLACDKYEWIYKYFFHCATKHLPQLNLDFVFFTENADSGQDNIHTIKLGREPWNNRMIIALDKHLKRYDNVIYLQEDYLIQDINITYFNNILEYHNQYNWYVTKLGVNHEFNVKIFPLNKYHDTHYLQDKNDMYLMSHQPVTIFNREFLLNTITRKTTGPSEHEIIGSNVMREQNMTEVHCFGPVFRPINSSCIFKIEHAIRQGKILPQAQKLMEQIDHENSSTS